jgi:hypothetical protein
VRFAHRSVSEFLSQRRKDAKFGNEEMSSFEAFFLYTKQTKGSAIIVRAKNFSPPQTTFVLFALRPKAYGRRVVSFVVNKPI